MMGEGEYYQNLVLTNDAGDTFITTNRGTTWTVITEENTTPDNKIWRVVSFALGFLGSLLVHSIIELFAS